MPRNQPVTHMTGKGTKSRMLEIRTLGAPRVGAGKKFKIGLTLLSQVEIGEGDHYPKLFIKVR